mgnify:CR=1 FL=1
MSGVIVDDANATPLMFYLDTMADLDGRGRASASDSNVASALRMIKLLLSRGASLSKISPGGLTIEQLERHYLDTGFFGAIVLIEIYRLIRQIRQIRG